MVTAEEASLTRPKSRRTLHLVDVGVVAWVIVCVLLGLRLHDEVQGLSGLTVTVDRVGGQLERIGGTVAGLELPLLGDELKGAGTDAQAAGTQARQQARVARESVEDVAWLLAVTVIVLAVFPVLLAYVPLRLRWHRGRAAHTTRPRAAEPHGNQRAG